MSAVQLSLFILMYRIALSNCFISPKSDFLLEIDGNGIALTRDSGCVIEQKYGVEIGGKLNCWGYNDEDETQPPEDLDFIQIIAGTTFKCGIAVDQTVHCWGGMSGVIPGLYTQISADCTSRFACGIQVDGNINCWGDRHVDRVVPTISGRFIQVSCSGKHCCALDEKGYPHCWGENHLREVNPPFITWGEFKESQENFGWTDEALTDDTQDDYADEEEQSPIINDDDKRLSLMQFRQISVTDDMSCGITLIGAHLRCWGSLALHKRGKWPLSAKGPFRQVSAGGLGVCAIVAAEEDVSGEEEFLKVKGPENGRQPDSLECWGTAKRMINPTIFPAWDQITVGTNYICGVSMDSQLSCGGLMTVEQSESLSTIVMA